ncbi:MAG: hypothetical protein AMXMBFR64_13910 [Myxococcales bacterium]
MEPSDGKVLVQALESHGFTFAAGVPCKSLRGALKHVESGGGGTPMTWLAAVCEPTAVGAATGAMLGGGRSVVFMSAAGLGRSLTALWSLSRAAELPLLLVIATDGDAHQALPQEHDLGATTGALLDVLGAGAVHLRAGSIPAQVAEALSQMESTRRPVALLAAGGVLA